MPAGVKVNIQIPPVIEWSLLVFATLSIIVLTHSGILWTTDLRYLWFAFYGLSIIVIINKLRMGLFFEPIVVVPSAYMLIIVIGSILFELIKGTVYSFYLSNLIGIGYFALFMGIILSQNYIYTINPGQIGKYIYEKPFMKSRTLTYFLTLMCILGTFALFTKGGVPMLSADPRSARLTLTSEGAIFNLFLFGLTVCPLAILYDSIARKSRKRLIWSHVFAGVVIVLTLAAGGRARTVSALFEYLAMYCFFNRRQFSLKVIFSCAILFVMFLATMGAYRKGAADVSGMLREVGGVVVARPVMLQLIIDNYPESQISYGARLLSNLAKLMPGQQASPNVDLKYAIWPDPDAMPELASVTPSIVGEAYMDFGVQGIFWFMFVYGIFLGLSYRWMVKKPTFLRCAFFFIFIIHMGTAVSAGLGPRLPNLVYLWVWLVPLGFLYEWKLKPTLSDPPGGGEGARGQQVSQLSSAI